MTSYNCLMRHALAALATVLAVSLAAGVTGVAAATPICGAPVTAPDGASLSVCLTRHPATLDNVSGAAGTYTAQVTVTGLGGTDTVGCPGQRAMPTPCVTFAVDGAYALTDLFPSAGPDPSTDVYSFALHPAFETAGSHQVSATAYLDGAPGSASAPLTVTGDPTPALPPSPNTGQVPSIAQTAVTVAAVGDGAAGTSAEAKVETLMAGWSPDLALYLGDVYQQGSFEEFLNFYAPAKLFGGLAAVTAATPGNHEYLDPGAEGYFWYWNYLSGAPDPGQPGRGAAYYSFDLPSVGWHIVSLDSEIDHTAGSAQVAWLESDLAAHPAPCTLAFWHRPRFTSGKIGGDASFGNFWTPLAAAGADLVLNGHAHDYERSRPLNTDGTVAATGGMVEIISGAGGDDHGAWAAARRPAWEAARDNVHFGAVQLTLEHGQAVEQFVGVNGTVHDAATIPCH
jgi:Calcineurin-like phosphoesterase